MNTGTAGSGMMWIGYALLTAMFWGVYGIFIHQGQIGMGDPANGRYKAFLLVGVAYFLTAILAPLAILMVKGASWSMPAKAVGFSLVAGTVGAAGAFCVLLAFANRGSPAAVMSIIFAGAPVINAIVAILWHPPSGGLGSIRAPFYLGIVLAAVGGGLVTFYKPGPAKAPPPDRIEADQSQDLPADE